MKISREVKAGLIVLIATVGLIWFINFLKGRNILRYGRTFYAIYEDVNGLEPTSAVTINGFRVGRVESIEFHPDLSGRLIVQIQIEENFQFSKNAVAKVYSPDLLGGKAVSIDISKHGELAKHGDTLPSALEIGITDVFSDRFDSMKDKIEHMVVKLDSTLTKASQLIDEENRKNISESLQNLNKTLIYFVKISESLNYYLDKNTGDVPKLIKTAENALNKFSGVADNINKINFESTISQLNQVISKLDYTLKKIKKGEGSLGLLVNDEQLYNNLKDSSKELKDLLKDLKENPKRYVHFSIFGKKNKKYLEDKK